MADAISLINPSVDISSFINILQDKTSYTLSISGSTTTSTVNHSYPNSKYWLIQNITNISSFSGATPAPVSCAYICIVPSLITDFVLAGMYYSTSMVLKITISTSSIKLTSNTGAITSSVICTPL